MSSVNMIRLLVLVMGFALFGKFALAENPNKFNRLFTPPSKAVEALKNDGIHDPDNPALKLLQEPKQAFKPLVKSTAGNAVDWVKSQEKGKIKPIYNHTDESEKALPMDLYIEMQVKGTMPDVSFPHNAHTRVLECANCHTDIFIPKKGANPMTMAQIMLGQKCGVCHGSVAFPVTECRRCHSVKMSKKKLKKAKRGKK